MTGDDLSPEDAFAQLGNETRVSIVRTLGETGTESLSFSELRERVGTRDSGQFNYHLNQLIGTFVRRTDGGRYELAYAGARVVGAILSGEFNRRGAVGTFTLESACAACGTSIEATYEDERVEVWCPSCEKIQTGFGFPPGGFEDRSVEELTRTFGNWILGILRFTTGGICYNCAGTVTGQLTDEANPAHEEDPVHVEFECHRCTDSVTMSVHSYLLLHPAVIAFHYDHGIDVYEGEPWNLEFLHDNTCTVRSADPWCVESVLELEGDRLTLVLEENLAVRVE